MNANSSNSNNPDSNKNSAVSDSSTEASPTNTAAAQSPTSSQGQQMWGGRFSEATDSFVAAFTASVGFDQRFARQLQSRVTLAVDHR